MKKNKLVVAQIGCGKFAQSQDLPTIGKHPQLELKWCCDINAEHAAAMARKFGAPCSTNDFNEVIADPEVDLIKIATSHEVHLPIIEAAAARGIHIFCEKPMAMEIEEAYKIIRAVRRNGIKLCVDLNRRMSPSLQALRNRWLEQVANPKHQPWRYVETERPLMGEEDCTNLLINIQDESSSYGMGHMDPLCGGGVIIGESVHWLDLACWFFAPQRPVELTAWGSSRLSHGITLKFSNGDSATLVFSCSGTFDYPKEMYQVSSKAALFQNLFFVENRYWGIPGAKTETFPMQHDPFAGEGPGEGFDAYMEKSRLRTANVTNNIKKLENAKPFLVDKGHVGMWNEFVDAILNDKPSPCDEMAGFMSTYLAKLAIQSIELKQTLPVPIEKITPVFV
jgi:predicted dehydrogenase